MSRVLQSLMRFASIPLDYPTIELENSEGTETFLGEIPATVYQTWETTMLTRRLHKSVSEFRQLNPELSFELYHADARDAYMEASWGHRSIYSVYKDAKFGPLKADVFRYCILFEHGGFYFDISKGVRRPLRKFINTDSRELLSFEGNIAHREPPNDLEGRLKNPNHLVAQWGFGFAPGHDILKFQIAAIEKTARNYRDRVFENPKAAILEFSGPIPFTESVWRYLSEDPTRQINQTQVDFNGYGIYSLPGSAGRFRQSASYVFKRNDVVLGTGN